MADFDPMHVQKHLAGLTYPASKTDLIQYAQEHEAEKEVLALLRMLPERQFSSPTEVSQAVGAIA
jgi:hypothetical protein